MTIYETIRTQVRTIVFNKVKLYIMSIIHDTTMEIVESKELRKAIEDQIELAFDSRKLLPVEEDSEEIVVEHVSHMHPKQRIIEDNSEEPSIAPDLSETTVLVQIPMLGVTVSKEHYEHELRKNIFLSEKMIKEILGGLEEQKKPAYITIPKTFEPAWNAFVKSVTNQQTLEDLEYTLNGNHDKDCTCHTCNVERYQKERLGKGFVRVFMPYIPPAYKTECMNILKNAVYVVEHTNKPTVVKEMYEYMQKSKKGTYFNIRISDLKTFQNELQQLIDFVNGIK